MAALYKQTLRKVLLFIGLGMAFTTALLATGVYLCFHQWAAVFACLACALLLFVWAALYAWILYRKLALFSEELCANIDSIMDSGDEQPIFSDRDTLLDRILFRLNRLYQAMQTTKRQLAAEHSGLQALVSDLSHQVKTPTTNLKLAVGILSEQELPREQQLDYLSAIAGQVEKLDFLMEAMIKASRLETGVIALKRENASLFETLADALSGIYHPAQRKQLTVTVDCPETLLLRHDRKWTSEALFNLLDNAVKYTPAGGVVAVAAVQWEAYTKITFTDSGRGIPEESYADIFKRFYRAPDVHDIEGVGIGLYLAREIIARQGGNITVSSVPGQGSVFTVFLPNR